MHAPSLLGLGLWPRLSAISLFAAALFSGTPAEAPRAGAAPTLTVAYAAWQLAPADEPDCTFRIDEATGLATDLVTSATRVPHLDIKPGSCPNSVNVAQGPNFVRALPMAVLGNGFDVTQVDLGTIHLSRVEGDLVVGPLVTPLQATFEDDGTPFLDGDEPCDCHDEGGDGFLDLHLKFDRDEVVEAFGLDLEETNTYVRLRISGRSGNGLGFRVTDCIRIINNH